LIKKQQYNHNCRRRVYITLLIHYTHHEPQILQPVKELGTEPALSQLDQLLLIGPTLKGTRDQVIYSLPFKYTLQVLQRTALGPVGRSWPGIYKFTLAIRGYTWIPIGSTNW